MKTNRFDHGFLIKNEDGGDLLSSIKDIPEAKWLLEEIERYPEDQRASVLARYEKLLSEKILQSRIAELDQSRPGAAAWAETSIELLRWQNEGLALERATASSLHHLRDALKDGRVRTLIVEGLGETAKFAPPPPEVLGTNAQTFVIEHDWMRAFAGAEDFSGVDFKLPFDSMCFEFRISGRNVCAVLAANGDEKLLMPFVEVDGDWVVPHLNYRQVGTGDWTTFIPLPDPSDDFFEPLRKVICDQIRAICISLEAEISTTEVVRVSEKLNRSRIKRGRAPIENYHIVKLAHRGRALPVGDDALHQGSKKRLHFRRGHWRHFANHRTWIKWMLVGDPDIGFIDKHYRL